MSRLFGDYISNQADELPADPLPPITEAMVGAIKRQNVRIHEEDHLRYLEEKYL